VWGRASRCWWRRYEQLRHPPSKGRSHRRRPHGRGHLLLFPEPFSAETALQWGLVHRVVEPGQVLPEVQALASRLAHGPTAAYPAVKTVLASAAVSSLDHTLALEARLQAALGLTGDHREAVEAFLAKRLPSFVGR
jgi:2-(1,2-epoxy-1,2-dihydrophenyl)acetyl-CoA isomerase